MTIDVAFIGFSPSSSLRDHIAERLATSYDGTDFVQTKVYLQREGDRYRVRISLAGGMNTAVSASSSESLKAFERALSRLEGVLRNKADRRQGRLERGTLFGRAWHRISSGERFFASHAFA